MNLRTYLRVRNVTEAEFARLVRVDVSTVYRWVSTDPEGRTMPSLERLAEVERVTRRRVTALTWNDPDEPSDDTAPAGGTAAKPEPTAA